MAYNLLPTCLTPDQVRQAEDERIVQFILGEIARGVTSTRLNHNISEQLMDALIARNFQLTRLTNGVGWIVKWHLPPTALPVPPTN